MGEQITAHCTDTTVVIEQLDLMIIAECCCALVGSINKLGNDLLQDKHYWLYGAEGEKLENWYNSVAAQKKNETSYLLQIN